MHPSRHVAARQRQRVQRHTTDTDSYAFFNLLTGPQLLDGIEALLPEHRERMFPPTETLSMFLAQVLSADGSCRQAVNDAALKRLVGGLLPCSTSTSAYCQARSRLPTEMISTLACQAGGIIAPSFVVALLARPSGVFGRWCHDHVGGYAGKSSRLSATE